MSGLVFDEPVEYDRNNIGRLRNGPEVKMGSGFWSAFKRQRFTYADGTGVTVDFASGTYEISPALKK